MRTHVSLGKDAPCARPIERLETLLRIRSLAAYTLQSRFRKRQGVYLLVIEKCLNYVSGSFSGIVGVYQRYNFESEMRAALERWACHVEGLTSGDPAEDVVSLLGLMA